MKQLLYTAILILIPIISTAQKIKLITKQEAIAKANEQNNSLKMAEQDVKAAQGDYRQTNAILLPTIGVSHTAMKTNNPLMAFGFKLNQEILTQNDFNPTLLNDPESVENYATKIEVQQPLLNFDGFYQRSAAKAKLNAAELQSERTKEYMSLEVEKAYMQLQLAYKAVDVLEKAHETALEHKRIADNSYKQGYLQKSDVLAVEVRVTEIENQLQYAKSNIINASNYLSVLMNDDYDKVLKPIDSLRVVEESFSENSILENRKDIQAYEKATLAYEKMYKADKMSFMPRLNLFGSYELYDDNIFQGDANGYLVGAALSWTIFEGSKRFGKTQKSKAAYEKSKFEMAQYKATSTMELDKAKRDLQDAKNNLKLSKLSLEQSEEALRIRTNRFKQGLEKTTDLLMSETQFAQKQLEYYSTVFKHNYMLKYVEFLTK
ncbi:TolC family protein [Aureibaculum marinum]|uniref:TolC family protein n=1 Tax=Aureibaculum marinum TaxID=2487930 RepID=A0A3N4NX47_9FLAO|nr:TolC family protein [Aureibaculum marinum]RPD96149.1 TolC family protein [Aureibaculum marinum]